MAYRRSRSSRRTRRRQSKRRQTRVRRMRGGKLTEEQEKIKSNAIATLASIGKTPKDIIDEWDTPRNIKTWAFAPKIIGNFRFGYDSFGGIHVLRVQPKDDDEKDYSKYVGIYSFRE